MEQNLHLNVIQNKIEVSKKPGTITPAVAAYFYSNTTNMKLYKLCEKTTDNFSLNINIQVSMNIIFTTFTQVKRESTFSFTFL